MNLNFDEASHCYTLDGKVVPSVTTVIGSCVPNEFAHLPDYHRNRGTVVHAAVAAALEGRKFKWSYATKLFKPRVDACLKFVQDAKLTPVLVEERMASAKYRVAGTVDLVAMNSKEEFVAVDWKGTITKTVDVQLGAYALLCAENGTGKLINRAVAVECSDSGQYKCRWLTAAELRTAGQVFQAMLTAWWWKERNGYNNPK